MAVVQTERKGAKLVVSFERKPSGIMRKSLEALGFKRYSNCLFIGGKNYEEAEDLCNRYRKQILRKRAKRLPETLCWDCQNAIGGCEWSEHFKPVDGWNAKATIINVTYCVRGTTNATQIDSYCVFECPKFVPDPK